MSTSTGPPPLPEYRPPRISTYIPFLRRFTNEAAQAERERRALYERAAAFHQAHAPDKREFVRAICSYPVPEAIDPALTRLVERLVADHAFVFDLPPYATNLSFTEEAAFKDLLLRKVHFFENQEAVFAQLDRAFRILWMDYAKGLPEMQAPSPFTVALLHLLPKPKELIGYNYWRYGSAEYFQIGVMAELVRQFYRNTYAAAGALPPPEGKERENLPWIDESDLPGDEWAKVYLRATPFDEFVKTPVPLQLTHQDRFNHWHILGGTGHGKTTLLENLIHYDLHSEDWPSLVVVDAHGDLIRKIMRHEDAFNPRGGRFADDLILISPKDTKYPPAINIFDMTRMLLSDYDDAAREQVTAGVIQTFDYLFSGLLGADLTAKQGVLFKMVARLMLAVPLAMGRNATVIDMMRLMEDPKPYEAAIRTLDPIPREFFERDFSNAKIFGQTKDQIRYRLQAILENPSMARLFTSSQTRVNFFNAMNRGAIILIDTAADFLKDASANYGKVMISLVLQAVMERAAIPERDRRSVFLVVDEAANYFDNNIDDLLTEVRKYKCGVVLAHQYLDQATPGLRSSLAANTGIKFAGGVSSNDARAMARDMRTDPDYILGQQRLRFAAHIRGVTHEAVSIPVRTGVFEGAPRLSDEQMKVVLDRNRDRVSFGPPAPPPRTDQEAIGRCQAKGEAPPRSPNEDFSAEW